MLLRGHYDDCSEHAAVVGALNMLCVIAVGRAVGAQRRSDADSTALGLAHRQDNAPVALHGYLAGAGTFLYETAKVENVSAKPISTVTFAVLVADPTHRRTPNFLRSSVVDVTLLPGKTQDLAVQLLPATQLEDLKRSICSHTGDSRRRMG
jgi:hypothetical protein